MTSCGGPTALSCAKPITSASVQPRGTPGSCLANSTTRQTWHGRGAAARRCSRRRCAPFTVATSSRASPERCRASARRSAASCAFRQRDSTDAAPGTAPDRGSYSAPKTIHHLEDRVIPVREAARLHRLPDLFRPSAASGTVPSVGTAVPPPLARAVAHEMVQRSEWTQRNQNGFSARARTASSPPASAAHCQAPAPGHPLQRDRRRGTGRRVPTFDAGPISWRAPPAVVPAAPPPSSSRRGRSCSATARRAQLSARFDQRFTGGAFVSESTSRPFRGFAAVPTLSSLASVSLSSSTDASGIAARSTAPTPRPTTRIGAETRRQRGTRPPQQSRTGQRGLDHPPVLGPRTRRRYGAGSSHGAAALTYEPRRWPWSPPLPRETFARP